eukprot:CAMPEP_0201285920 /NCGR_PEP_ID=MMETSP1317-20130820/114017_1 /ASSEMBLY_ACC=CAM_ASM_000770 /TAXON_ID=187299 /ORGANISM="Undescribed Undescribed, Strain Undescribed" /LENGTH=90 /DNA_ID=CAMNT_0047612121 /DNA_START=774 /DNA_END=1046 /DNA_ORIENTATION=-
MKYIGNSGDGSSPWGNSIDEFRVWSAVIEKTDLKGYYDNGLTASSITNLEIYYKFDEGKGTIYDEFGTKDATVMYPTWKEGGDCDWVLAV